jgi:hypothetical protein
MTPWREFSAIDMEAVREIMAGDVLIDPFAVLDGTGFSHQKLGS